MRSDENRMEIIGNAARSRKRDCTDAPIAFMMTFLSVRQKYDG